MSSTYTVGLDLGQAADYTAIAVVERREVGTGQWIDRGPRQRLVPVLNAFGYGSGEHRLVDEGRLTSEETTVHLDVVHLERLPLGTSYVAVAKRVQALMAEPTLAEAALVVDGTGVGRAVIDLLRAAGLQLHAITITAGATVTGNGWSTHVPKRDLVGALQVHLQTGALKIARGLPEAETLVRELLSFKAKITDAGNDTYAAWREGSHDDLVLATALAAWWAERAAAPLFY